MLWKDRRFWTVVVDGLASGATLVVGKFVAPDYMEIALWAVAFYQSVAACLIGILTAEAKAAAVEAKLTRQIMRHLERQ